MLTEFAGDEYAGEGLSHQICIGSRHEGANGGDDEAVEACPNWQAISSDADIFHGPLSGNLIGVDHLHKPDERTSPQRQLNERFVGDGRLRPTGPE